jgi:hypothetical protein
MWLLKRMWLLNARMMDVVVEEDVVVECTHI